MSTSRKNFEKNADRLVERVTTGLVISQGVVMENLAVILLMLTDVMTGLISMSLMFGTLDEDASLLTWMIIGMSILLQLLTSAIQYVIWKIIFSVAKWWTQWKLIIPAVVLMFCDTAIDTTLANFLVYRKSPLDFPLPLEETHFGYWMAFIIIMVGTGFNEALVQLTKYRKWNNPAQRQRTRRKPTPKKKSYQQQFWTPPVSKPKSSRN